MEAKVNIFKSKSIEDLTEAVMDAVAERSDYWTPDYNYLEVVAEDVLNAIIADEKLQEIALNADSNSLHDALWCADSVTGNGSGSYTFNAYKAEEALCHNWELLSEALAEFGCEGVNVIEKGAEWCDVTIRCYLLPIAIECVLEAVKRIS